MSKDAAALATPIPGHDPNQPAREIPDVTIEIALTKPGKFKEAKMTIDAQMACVSMATAALGLSRTGSVSEALQVSV